MHLYFLRHGKAEEHAADRPDHDRHLVERGVADAKIIADLLKMIAVVPDAVYTSPYPRAQETARIVAETLNVPRALSERAELEAGRFNMGGLQKLVSTHKKDAVLLFTGHEPDLSEIIHLLCGAQCEMKTASLACIGADRAEPGHGVLHWLLAPKLLRGPSHPDM